MIGLRLLDYDSHCASNGTPDEWVTVSYRRWWWPFSHVTETLFSAASWDTARWMHPDGSSFDSWEVRRLVMEHKARERQLAAPVQLRRIK